MKRVLIAVDDSVESLTAARAGARLAAGWNASVRLLTVIAGRAAREAETAAQTADGAVRRGEAQRLLDHVAREVRAAGVSAESVDAAISEGEPFQRILEEAHAWQADLIVMAVAHRTGLRSPYVGSQTEHVLEFTECPVLVVPRSPQPQPR